MSTLNLSRLYRAVVEPDDWRKPARHAFIEASNHNVAVKKLAAVIVALERCSLAALADGRIHNVYGLQELTDEGMGADVELRIFETGWNGHTPTYVAQPLFLVDEPALIRLWCRCPESPAMAGEAQS
jgi:hypothetical protein